VRFHRTSWWTNTDHEGGSIGIGLLDRWTSWAPPQAHPGDGRRRQKDHHPPGHDRRLPIARRGYGFRDTNALTGLAEASLGHYKPTLPT
jgi:hypothetical protein